jgi:hypothetical protein
MNAVAPLPDVSELDSAKLPAVYEGAKRALEECARVDECKSWADKAAAIKSYARQMKDDSLRLLALRIQARAERRVGELLKETPRADESTRFGRAGDVRPPVTRTQIASEAGLSEHRRKQAMRVASVPADSFQNQVESESPPSISRLAEQGKATRAGASHPPASRDAIEARQAILRFALFCEEHEPRDIANGIPPEDIEGIRESVQAIDRWLDVLVSEFLA